MLKALIKKQIAEFFAPYFMNRKTGKRKSHTEMIGFGILMGVLFLFLAGIFFMMGIGMTQVFVAINMEWLLYSIMGLIAITLGVVGSVFSTYAGLYQAKDNEMLISMPIPSSYILLSRLVGVYVICLMYSALVWIPAAISYWITAGCTLTNVIFPIILLFFIGVVDTVITCILGWIVALIAGKTKNKTVITVIISAVFLIAYLMFCSQMSTVMEGFIANSAAIGGVISRWIYPVAQLGYGATGDAAGLMIFILISIAVFAICWFVLSKTFINFATKKTGEKKKAYKAGEVRVKSLQKALLQRELSRFKSSSVYILNTGIGAIFMVIVAVMAIINRNDLLIIVSFFKEAYPFVGNAVPVIAVGVMCFMIAMCPVSAPSVSLEGKNLWIVRSLPVKASEALNAKINMHMFVITVPTVVSTVIIGAAINMNVGVIMLMTLLAVVFTLFIAYLGIVLNLKRPNFTWTSEVIPIKQSMPVSITLFGGWIIALGIIGLGILMGGALGDALSLIVILAIFIVIDFLINKWIKTRGAAIFDEM